MMQNSELHLHFGHEIAASVSLQGGVEKEEERKCVLPRDAQSACNLQQQDS